MPTKILDQKKAQTKILPPTQNDEDESSLSGLIRDEEGQLYFDYGNLDELAARFGTETTPAAAALLRTLSFSIFNVDRPFEGQEQAFVPEFKPQGIKEALLVSQITTTHFAFTQSAMVFNTTKNHKSREAAERSMNRFSRTLMKQLELLDNWRSPLRANRNVKVESGGQAIVGSTINYDSNKN